MSGNQGKSGTTIDEIANGIFRISTSVPPAIVPGGFTFNQFLIVDDAPLLFHTGMRRMFEATRGAIESISRLSAQFGGVMNHQLDARWYRRVS